MTLAPLPVTLPDLEAELVFARSRLECALERGSWGEARAEEQAIRAIEREIEQRKGR